MKIKHLLKRTCLSLALLIGAGTAWAQYSVVASCDFTKKANGHSAYNDLWTYDTDWDVFGGANNNKQWAFVKLGAKKGDKYNPIVYINNKTTISQAITIIKVNTNDGNLTYNNLTSWALCVYSDSEMKTRIDSVVGAKMTVKKAESLSFTPTTGTSWPSGSYYKIRFDVTEQTSGNGIVWLNSIDFCVPDKQAPIFDELGGYPKITNKKATSVDLLVKADETCKVYFMAVAAGADEPTANAIIANDSVSCASNTETSATISGLTKATAYDIYVIAKDNAGNQQAAATKIPNVTTDNREISSASIASKLYTGEDATVTWSSDGIAADANVKIELLSSNASVALAASTANDGSETVNIPAATAYGTDYKIRISLADESDLYDETDNITIIPNIAINELLTNTDGNGESNYKSKVVRVKGLVTGIKTPSTDYKNFTIQNGNDVFNAAYVYYCQKDGDTSVAIGDNVYVEGLVSYYHGLLQIGSSDNDAHAYATIINHDNDLPEPVIVSVKDAQSKAYINKIVKLIGVTYTGKSLKVSATDSIKTGNNLVNYINNGAFTGGNLSLIKNRKYDIIGAISYNNDYQLWPRSKDTTAVTYTGKDRTYTIDDIYLYNNDTTLSILRINGRDVKSDAKAVKVIDFSSCKGIEVQTKDAKASFNVKVNGNAVAAADLATKTLAENDVVTIIVTAEDGTVGTRNIKIQKDNRTFHFADLSTTTFNTGSTIALSWTQQNVDSLDLYFNNVKLNNTKLTSETSFSYTVPNGVYGTGSIEAIDCEDKLSIGSIVVTINDTQAPAALKLAPANAATNVATNVNLTISFDEAVKVANGAMLKANTAEAKIVVINDTAVKAYFENLDYATEYTVTLPAGSVTDAAGNTPTLSWKFTTKPQPVPELFFSEYATGSSNNKYLEIYNPTDENVNLSNYFVHVGTWSNAGNFSTTDFSLSGILASKEVFVIVNSSAADSLRVVADTVIKSNIVNFNGDDALRLYKVIDGDTSLIDEFGTYHIDPGTAWTVAGIEKATVTHTLIRKDGIVCGSTDWAEQAGTDSLDSQWIVKEKDVFSDIGRHGMSLKITNSDNAANIDYKNHTITIEAVYGTDLTSILPQFSLPHGTTATINGIAVTENATFNFSQPAILLITTEDGTTTKWTITITVAAQPSTAAEIRTFSFANAKPLSINIDTAAASISALFDYGADITALTPVFTISAAASVSETTLTIDSLQQYTSVEPIDFSTPWTVKVQAQDPKVSKLWTISASTLQPEALTIYQIQYTDKDASAYVGKFVSTIGVITSINGKEIYIQDSASAWNGVLVYDAKEVAKDAKAGDKVKVIGNVTEYSTITEIELAAIEILSSGNNVEPIVMTIEDAESEAYEAVLVTFKNVTCKRIDTKGNYIIEDATDTLTVYNKYKLDSLMIVDSVYDVTGIMHYYPAGKVYEIIPRSTADIVKIEKEYNGGNGDDDEGGNGNNSAVDETVANVVSIAAYDLTIVVENANADIAVFDISGRMVAKRAANSNRIELQLSKAGLYIVKVGTTSQKVVLK